MDYSTHYITSYEQAKVFSNKMRMRIISLFVDSIPKTSKQLADLLGLPPAKVHYHVRELYRVGLLRLVETKEKGGVIEKYYLPIADEFEIRLDRAEELARLNEGQLSGRYVMAKGVIDEYRDSFLKQVEETDRKLHEQPIDTDQQPSPLYMRMRDGIQMNVRNVLLTSEQQEQFLNDLQAVFDKWDNNTSDPRAVPWKVLFAIHKAPHNP